MMMRWIGLLKVFLFFYLIFTLFAIYRLYQSKRSDRLEHNSSNKHKIKHGNKPSKSKVDKPVVEIWGKAAIGLYLWKHILEAPLENVNGELEQYGEIKYDGMNVRFRTGALITPDTIDKETSNAVLVINGREKNKISFAKAWLESLKRFKSLQNLAVILLGNEQCDNDWLMKYMVNKGGFVKMAFIIYDIPYVDNNVFNQWPLGVATYRKFPQSQLSMISKERRKYLCNFLGTVYKKSSREELMKVVNSNEEIKKKCLVHFRYDWLPNETKETSEIYQNALKNSELTLCPVGINTECYRIYEAISFGSIPVVEDVMTPGRCGGSPSEKKNHTPLRILKELNAPLIYVKSWQELPEIIASEMRLSKQAVLARRERLLKWYQKFKYKLRNRFLTKLKKGFGF